MSQLIILVLQPTASLLWFTLSSTLFPASAGRGKAPINQLLLGDGQVASSVQRCEIGQGLNFSLKLFFFHSSHSRSVTFCVYDSMKAFKERQSECVHHYLHFYNSWLTTKIHLVQHHLFEEALTLSTLSRKYNCFFFFTLPVFKSFFFFFFSLSRPPGHQKSFGLGFFFISYSIYLKIKWLLCGWSRVSCLMWVSLTRKTERTCMNIKISAIITLHLTALKHMPGLKLCMNSCINLSACTHLQCVHHPGTLSPSEGIHFSWSPAGDGACPQVGNYCENLKRSVVPTQNSTETSSLLLPVSTHHAATQSTLTEALKCTVFWNGRLFQIKNPF